LTLYDIKLKRVASVI